MRRTNLRPITLRVLATLASVAVVGAFAACADKDTATAPIAATGRTVYLSVPTLTPAAGDQVVLSIKSTGGSGNIGSFKLRLALTSGVEYLGTVPQTEGMVFANAVQDTLVLVGASSSGFTSGTLASIKLKVTSPAALSGLALRVAEMNSTTFTNEAASTLAAPRVIRGTMRTK
jgi:hypothetical protein